MRLSTVQLRKIRDAGKLGRTKTTRRNIRIMICGKVVNTPLTVAEIMKPVKLKGLSRSMV